MGEFCRSQTTRSMRIAMRREPDGTSVTAHNITHHVNARNIATVGADARDSVGETVPLHTNAYLFHRVLTHSMVTHRGHAQRLPRYIVARYLHHHTFCAGAQVCALVPLHTIGRCISSDRQDVPHSDAYLPYYLLMYTLAGHVVGTFNA